MDFGIFVPCHRMDDSVSTREVYDQALETVRLADDAGFRIAWFPEHHLIHYYSCLHAQIEEQIAELKPARRPRWAVSRMTFVGETTAEALQAMEVVQISHRIFTHLFRNQATVKGGFTVPDPVDDEYPTETLLANLVAGTPEACVEKLRMYE